MRLTRLRVLYRRHFRDHRRERLFLSSLAFFTTFGVTRTITHAARGGTSVFAGLWLRGTHVHHLVWGILLLLGVGYGWLLQVGAETNRTSLRAGRVLALLYGVGAALTLDEFALWLNLEDVYWAREGRASVDAVALFGGLVSVGLWGGPFLRGLTRQLGRLLRRR